MAGPSRRKRTPLKDCCKVPANLKDWDCYCSIYSDCQSCHLSFQCIVCLGLYTRDDVSDVLPQPAPAGAKP